MPSLQREGEKRTHPCPPYIGREKREDPPLPSLQREGEEKTHPGPPYRGREKHIYITIYIWNHYEHYEKVYITH